MRDKVVIISEEIYDTICRAMTNYEMLKDSIEEGMTIEEIQEDMHTALYKIQKLYNESEEV
jgi:hypothetical protein